MLIEICVDSPNGLAAAIAGGADRIELCGALATGGLTPSAGLLAQARTCPVPVRVMIRPRAGDFRFSAAEQDAMRRDIDAVREAGLDGVVIGASDAAGALDAALIARLVDHAAGLRVTLHRIVDLLPDPAEAVDLAVALGIATILTSGGAPTAWEGATTIRAMRERAAGRVEILAGGGVRPDNAAALVAATGVSAVHASCSGPVDGNDPRLVRLGFSSGQERVTDAAAVARLRAVLCP